MLGPYPNLPILGNLGSNVHAHFIWIRPIR
jgi:hypothetical protein